MKAKTKSVTYSVLLIYAVFVLVFSAYSQQDTPKPTPATAETSPSGLNQDDSGAYQTAKQSLTWMTESLQRMAEKLDIISGKLDPNASEEDINREVKRAMREAFSDLLPLPNVPVESKKSLEVSGPSTLDATNTIERDGGPILDPAAPAWMKQSVIDRELVRIPIESSVETTLELCRTEFDAHLPTAIMNLLDEHVLRLIDAKSIPELNVDYISSQLIKRDDKTGKDIEYDLILDRPSGTYHQLWKLVQIGPNQLQEIKRWERAAATHQRVQRLGGAVGSTLGLLAVVSGATGLVAKRQRSRKVPAVG